jgi:hypothetical protein
MVFLENKFTNIFLNIFRYFLCGGEKLNNLTLHIDRSIVIVGLIPGWPSNP